MVTSEPLGGIHCCGEKLGEESPKALNHPVASIRLTDFQSHSTFSTVSLMQVNDMKEGYGTLTYQNGEKYDGFWKADKVGFCMWLVQSQTYSFADQR